MHRPIWREPAETRGAMTSAVATSFFRLLGVWFRIGDVDTPPRQSKIQETKNLIRINFHVAEKYSKHLGKHSRFFFRKSQLKAWKEDKAISPPNKPICECPPDDPQTEEFDVDASSSLSSSSSLDDFSSFQLDAGNAIKPYQINASTANFDMSRGRIPSRVIVERPP